MNQEHYIYKTDWYNAKRFSKKLSGIVIIIIDYEDVVSSELIGICICHKRKYFRALPLSKIFQKIKRLFREDK